MTHISEQRIPRASLREQWSVSSVQRLAWAMGRSAAVPLAQESAASSPPSGPASVTPLHDPERRARRMDALARLATDPSAAPAERALAAQRLAELGRSAVPEWSVRTIFRLVGRDSDCCQTDLGVHEA